MASEAELVLLSNAVHNEKAPPGGWILDLSKPFGDIQINQYKNANGEVVVAIKGTDSFADWKNVNPSFVTGSYTDDMRELVDHVAKLSDRVGKENLSVTGFSQGGGLAQVISEAFGIGGLAIDPPGGGEITANPEFAEHLASFGLTVQGVPNDFVSKVENESPVSKIGEHLGAVEVVNLTEDGLATLMAMLSSVVIASVPNAMLAFVAGIVVVGETSGARLRAD